MPARLCGDVRHLRPDRALTGAGDGSLSRVPDWRSPLRRSILVIISYQATRGDDASLCTFAEGGDLLAAGVQVRGQIGRGTFRD